MENSVLVRLNCEETTNCVNTRQWDVLKIAIASIFAAFNFLLNFLVIAIIHDRVPETPRLPDISFEIIPELKWGLTVAEYIISTQAFLVFTLLVLHQSRGTLFRRLCLIMGVIYFARAVCMASTQVPLIKSDYCEPKMQPGVSWGQYLKEIFTRVNKMLWGFGLSINGHHVYCGDYIFSGHTVTLTFCK